MSKLTKLGSYVTNARNSGTKDFSEISRITDVYLQGEYTLSQLALITGLPKTSLWRKIQKNYELRYKQ